jgi:hypothetical protein
MLRPPTNFTEFPLMNSIEKNVRTYVQKLILMRLFINVLHTNQKPQQ